MEGNPTGRMGLADYLGWQWKSKADIPIVCVPGCPVQPDNLMETLLYLLLHGGRTRSHDSAGSKHLRPTWLFGQTVHEGCDRGGYYEQARVCRRLRITAVHRQAGMLGTGGAMQCGKTGMDGRNRRLSERRRHLYWMYDAGFPRQVYAVHESAARLVVVSQCGADLRKSHSRFAQVYPNFAEPGAELATPSGCF